jgi:mRNA-degrading endonuclease RelE of RelBE toxin-antitoxin system
MELIETPIFSRQVTAELSDGEYRLLQLHLLQHPDSGPIIPGSGGLRKLRWGLPGRGKRGGARIIYYWKSAAGRLYLVFLYPKSERSLSRAQLQILRTLVD